jgi:serine/threonine-protein kinase
MSDNDESLPRLLGGRYRLEAKLGSGGMGVVYRATDLTMKRAVAVKLIRGVDGVALDEEVAGRFLREAKNTARIQHENIIEVYDLGRSDQGDMFFVMELLEGESLSAKLRREGKLKPAIGVNIARQMCAALHVAHSAGIIHRDLKPANVMLIDRGGHTDYVKVLDFGVAKSYTPDQQTQLTHTGMLVGTVEYMAPEQIMGRVVDGRTDIYSLGIVMYRMFAGKAPFRDGGVPALIHAHLNVFPKPMTDTAPEIPGALDRVILRCLAKAPEQRYESMEELGRALVSALEPEHLGLVSLEYESDDPYDAGVQTEIARPGRDGRERDSDADLESLPSLAVSSDPPGALDEGFDDATVKMERPDAGGLGKPRPRPMPHADEAIDRTAIMSREESTAKRSIPEEVKRIDSTGPRECAMCRTINPPHARACSACGVSLAREDQEAVRVRVTAPRASHPSGHIAPQQSPGTGSYPGRFDPNAGGQSAPFPAHGSQGHLTPTGQQPMAHAQHGHPQSLQGGNGLQQGMAWGTSPPSSSTGRATPPSAWQRFLTWTGLKAR